MLWLVIALVASAGLAFALMGYVTGLSRIPDINWALPYAVMLMVAFIAVGVSFHKFDMLPCPAAWLVGVIVGRIVRATRGS